MRQFEENLQKKLYSYWNLIRVNIHIISKKYNYSLYFPDEAGRIESMIAEFFNKGKEIYKGYVDDPRNTDNAWMETVAMNFHDETGGYVGKFNLKAGDDAKSVTWMDIHKNLELYASHCNFIEAVAKLHNAHW